MKKEKRSKIRLVLLLSLSSLLLMRTLLIITHEDKGFEETPIYSNERVSRDYSEMPKYYNSTVIVEEKVQEMSYNEEESSNLEDSDNQIIEGEALLSHYCACELCCSPIWGFKTADGTQLWNGMDDPYIVASSYWPLGTEVEIDGVIYTVRDTGSAARLSEPHVFDVFVPGGHQEALNLGLISTTYRILS